MQCLFFLVCKAKYLNAGALEHSEKYGLIDEKALRRVSRSQILGRFLWEKASKFVKQDGQFLGGWACS